MEAVRDLIGTIDPECAGKGILVTTSDFTPASYKIQQETRLHVEAVERMRLLVEWYLGHNESDLAGESQADRERRVII